MLKGFIEVERTYPRYKNKVLININHIVYIEEGAIIMDAHYTNPSGDMQYDIINCDADYDELKSKIEEAS